MYDGWVGAEYFNDLLVISGQFNNLPRASGSLYACRLKMYGSVTAAGQFNDVLVKP